MWEIIQAKGGKLFSAYAWRLTQKLINTLH